MTAAPGVESAQIKLGGNMKIIPATEIPIPDSKDGSDTRTVEFEQMHHSKLPGRSTFTELSVGSGDEVRESVHIEITLHKASRDLTGLLILTFEQTERLIEGLQKAISDAKERDASYAEYEASQKNK